MIQNLTEPELLKTCINLFHAYQEESIHKTLDKALQAAFLMKQTTDRMADALSADLAKAQLQRKLQGLHPLGSRAGS